MRLSSLTAVEKQSPKTADRAGTEQWLLARDYLDATWARVVSEFQALQAGKRLVDPLCLAPPQALSEQLNEHTFELAAIRLALFQSGAQPAARGQTLGAADD